jgi:hypothetical protein
MLGCIEGTKVNYKTIPFYALWVLPKLGEGWGEGS